MKTKAFFNKIPWICAALLLSLFCVFQSVHIKTANAEETTVTYTDVMTDLQKDEDFNPDDYPAKADDYSLQVIQIAESVNNELFVYVYQPSNDTKDLIATSINISMTIDDELNPLNYFLTLISTNGVFDKYVVKDFSVQKTTVRYYQVISIYRKFDSLIDKESSVDFKQETSEIAFKVGALWTCMSANNGVVYAKEIIDILEVKTQIVGYIVYDNGWFFDGVSHEECRSYFVAFSTDRTIDELYSASLSFSWERYSVKYNVFDLSDTSKWEIKLLESKTNDKVDLHYSQVASNEDKGFLGKKYTWNRIEDTEAFVKANKEDINLTKGHIDALDDTQWILRFTERPFGGKADGMVVKGEYTDIFDVSILRLEFRTGAKTYNLGVVSNKTTGGEFAKADNDWDDFWDDLGSFFADMWGWLLGILLLGGLVIVLLNFAPWIFALVGKGFLAVFKWIGKILLWILRLIWRIISLPFKLIGKLFKRKNKKE